MSAQHRFLETLSRRVVIADGGMGTMLQTFDPTLEDYDGYEGLSDILCLTRPDIVLGIHDAYLAAGADCVETNSFNANYGGLIEYGIADRARELAGAAARLARQKCDEYATPERPRFVLGSMGGGTRLPTLGHAPYAILRDHYRECVLGLIEGGADAILVETSQDLLQAKAAVIGAKRANTELGTEIPIIAQVTVETTGTMLVGGEIGAALTSLAALDVDLIGLNCATGPAEMSEHLRYLSRHSPVPISVMPNAGLPVLGPNGAVYPLTPAELADAHEEFVTGFGVNLVGGCCGTTPNTSEPSATASTASSPPSANRSSNRASPPPTTTSPSSRTPRSSTSANAPTPTAPKPSAKPCSRPTTTAASRSPASRPAAAPTCSTCASTTSAATAPRT
ncbi:hypothetical protein GCM10029992_43360 [Glycomyces albus]